MLNFRSIDTGRLHVTPWYKIEQLQEIRKVRLARIVCDNSDNIETAQVYVMVLPDPEM